MPKIAKKPVLVGSFALNGDLTEIQGLQIINYKIFDVCLQRMDTCQLHILNKI